MLQRQQAELAALQSALDDARRESERLELEQQQLLALRRLGAFYDAFASRVPQARRPLERCLHHCYAAVARRFP